METARGRLAGMVAEALAGQEQRPVLVGLLGRGIESSRSPMMHEREGARIGLPYRYLLIDFDVLGLADGDLGAVVGHAQALGFAGLNVTHPFKQSVIPLLGALSAEAAAIGAVNTVVFSGAERAGHNTDCWGFAESFAEGLAGAPAGRVVQFGAGGAGAAVAQALLTRGIGQLVLVDPDGDRARQLAAQLASRFGRAVTVAQDVRAEVAAAQGIVNATPVGMAKYPGTPFPSAWLEPHHWVAEIIYFPPETELLRQARQRGCRTLAGTGMAVYQAVKAFELFTGIAPDRSAMTRHFQAAA